MSRYARKTDTNQPEIIERYESQFCSVKDLSRVGDDCPDLLVGIAGFTDLVEVKYLDGKNKLSEGQAEFIRDWRGARPIVVRTVEEVDEHVARRRREARGA